VNAHLYASINICKLKPRETAYELYDSNKVDLQPWKYARIFSAFIMVMVIGVYAFFSPIGIAQSSGNYSPMSFVFMAVTLVIFAGVYWFWKKTTADDEKINSETSKKAI
jgi:solute:Na+ symporter, SSS family